VATWMDQKAWAQPLDAAEQAAATSVTGDAGQLAAIAARWRGEC
jgi:hypothetical protein